MARSDFEKNINFMQIELADLQLIVVKGPNGSPAERVQASNSLVIVLLSVCILVSEVLRGRLLRISKKT